MDYISPEKRQKNNINCFCMGIQTLILIIFVSMQEKLWMQRLVVAPRWTGTWETTTTPRLRRPRGWRRRCYGSTLTRSEPLISPWWGQGTTRGTSSPTRTWRRGTSSKPTGTFPPSQVIIILSFRLPLGFMGFAWL